LGRRARPGVGGHTSPGRGSHDRDQQEQPELPSWLAQVDATAREEAEPGRLSFLDGEGAPVAEVRDRRDDGATVMTRRAVGLYRDGELVEWMTLPWTATERRPECQLTALGLTARQATAQVVG
jgi:hypothetical protein